MSLGPAGADAPYRVALVSGRAATAGSICPPRTAATSRGNPQPRTSTSRQKASTRAFHWSGTSWKGWWPPRPCRGRRPGRPAGPGSSACAEGQHPLDELGDGAVVVGPGGIDVEEEALQERPLAGGDLDQPADKQQPGAKVGIHHRPGALQHQAPDQPIAVLTCAVVWGCEVSQGVANPRHIDGMQGVRGSNPLSSTKGPGHRPSPLPWLAAAARVNRPGRSGSRRWRCASGAARGPSWRGAGRCGAVSGRPRR